MLARFRGRRSEESGFTLVELLVVMLILGILAAIALPSFFSQRDKASDADAKADVRTAETAMEKYAIGHDGTYAGADVAALRGIETTLPTTGLTATPTTDGGGYTVTTTSSTGNTFSIVRDETGQSTFPCTTAGRAGCPSGTAGWGG